MGYCGAEIARIVLWYLRLKDEDLADKAMVGGLGLAIARKLKAKISV